MEVTQPELFQDVPTQRVPPRRQAQKPVFATRRITVSASAQQVALAGALAVVMLVAVFALGVEQGKRHMRSLAGHASSASAAGHQLLPAPAPPAVAALPRVSPTASPSVAPRTPAATLAPASSQYTIQLATYTNRAEGERELAKLKQAGYTAYLNVGHQRVALCVGSFPTREAATKQLAAFRKKFHDCFVRQR